jgi:hypothetical protein
MAELLTATCPQCSQVISSDDTIVYGFGVLAHLDCRRPRVLSAEERTLALLYCHDHEVAECSTCARAFRLRELSSQNQFGVRLHACPWCHTDLTDAIRAHLYGCVMLPAEVRRRAQEARAAAQHLVKESQQLRDNEHGLMREAEAALHALRATLRRPPTRSGERSHVCPMTSSPGTSRSETASPTRPVSGKSPVTRTRPQAATT